MRSLVLTLIIFFSFLSFSSCKKSMILSGKNSSNRLFEEFLSSIVNDTNVYTIPMLEIIDENVYPVLDSVINATEKCRYFDHRIKNLYAFSFYTKIKDEELIYSIGTHRSFNSALGIDYKFILDEDLDRGAFFYKNYLFTIQLSNSFFNQEAYSFSKKTDCNYRLRGSYLFEEKSYDSSLDFIYEDGNYIIKRNGICGN